MRDPSVIIRLLLVFSAAVSIAWCTSPVSVALAAQVREENIDRPGNDYNNSIPEVSHWFDQCDLNSFERSRSYPRFKPGP
jgi:hypothetical protein